MSYVTQEKQGRVSSMGLAVLINGSIILAVLLSPMVADTIKPDPRTEVFFVPDKKVPPPPPPDPTNVQDPKPLDPVYTPDTLAPLPTNNDISTTTELPPIQPPVGGTGTSVNPPADPPVIKPPLPVALFVAAARDPRYANDFQPPYPRILETRGVEGLVKIRVLIGKDGRVRQAQIVSATDPKFGEAAQKQALRSWRFKPATRGGEPVEDWQTLTVRFTVDNK